MSDVIKPDQLTVEITKALNEYVKYTEEQVDKALDSTAEIVRDELEKASPKKTGKYAKGWKVKKGKSGKIVYNKEAPQRTVWLEYGHLTRLGTGRVQYGKIKHTKAVEHIKPINDKTGDIFVEELKKIL